MTPAQQIIYWIITGFYAFLVIIFGLSLILGIITRVPFVPTSKKVSRRLIEVANLKDGDQVYDLGCGDGRLLIEAEKQKKVQGTGYEVSPMAYLLGLFNIFRNKSKIKINYKNFFKEKISNADVIFLYLIPDIMPKVSKKLQKECRKGTRIISNSFHLPELEPVKVYERDNKNKYPPIYIYEI